MGVGRITPTTSEITTSQSHKELTFSNKRSFPLDSRENFDKVSGRITWSIA
jgi:hypothetical protein